MASSRKRKAIGHLSVAEQANLQRGLRLLGCRSYGEYLRSPHWRRLVRKWRKKACEYCGSKTRLCLHHRTYVNLGAELRSDLKTLCETCHRAEHGIRVRPRRARKKRKP